MVWENPVVGNNLSADTATFALQGGTYSMNCIGTGFGTVDLKILGQDGSTFFSVLAAAFAANGYKSFTIPPGVYKVTISTTTAVYFRIDHIPS